MVSLSPMRGDLKERSTGRGLMRGRFLRSMFLLLWPCFEFREARPLSSSFKFRKPPHHACVMVRVRGSKV